MLILWEKSNHSSILYSFFSFKKLSKPLICETCFKKFIQIDLGQVCLGCSRPQSGQELCLDCQKWKKKDPESTLNHTALFTYNEMAKKYMKEFKFQGDLIFAELFTAELSEAIKGYQKTHYIVPIPISKESMAIRGFSQVNLLLEKSGIQYKDWLSHTGKGKRQSTKNRKDRLLSKQFLVVNLELDEWDRLNKPILIVDDVYTTGRTIMHAKNAFHTFAQSINCQQFKNCMEIESFSLFR